MPGTQRVFIALWPPAQVRAALAEIAARLIAQVPPGGRLVPAANLHLTLAFIGSLEDDRVAELAPLVERCRCAPFSWRLDRLGGFDRARVLWAGGEAVEPLEQLAASARAILDRQRIAYDRKPFAPHVTLVRDAGRLPPGAAAITPAIDWLCERATLVRSTSGGRAGAGYVPITRT